MSFIRGGETIVIKRRTSTSKDDWGNSTYSVATITVKDALLAIGGTSEPVDPTRDAIDATVTLYLPNGTQIQDGDRFLIRGTEWVKDGDALEWISPFPASSAGVVVKVRRRRG